LRFPIEGDFWIFFQDSTLNDVFVLYKFFLRVFEQSIALALDHAVTWETQERGNQKSLISSDFWTAEKTSSYKSWKNLHVTICFGTWSQVIVG